VIGERPCKVGAQAISILNGSPVAVCTASPWRLHAVIYEIYPRSSRTQTGMEIGDLNGITRRLD